MIKETNEEANLPLELAEKIQPAGCVRYIHNNIYVNQITQLE